MSELRIGVDGGGTTTRAVIVNENLEVLGRGQASSSNIYGTGLENALASIEQAVQNALEDARRSGAGRTEAQRENRKIAGWGLGLAGACTRAEQELLRAHLQPVAARLGLGGEAPLVVDEDAAAAQAGAFGGAAGAVCIAGTGANCWGVNEAGERARADGAGPLLGDRGSGYRIGETTLRAACAASDGSGPATALLPLVLSHYGVPSIDELAPVVYRPDFGKDRVAALFPVVVEAAGDGDEVASQLLHEAGQQLAATALSVLRRLAMKEPRVAPVGGVLGRDTPVRAAFESSLQHNLPGVRIEEPLFDAAVGATLLLGPL